MRRFLITLMLFLIPAVLAAGEPTTNPIRYTWIASSCTTWNCAAAALVLANGDKHVIVLPTGMEERPWIVLRRVEEGSIYIPEDEPFRCEVFDGVSAASGHYQTVAPCRMPLVLNVPDGRAVVAALNDCSGAKRRATR